VFRLIGFIIGLQLVLATDCVRVGHNQGGAAVRSRRQRRPVGTQETIGATIRPAGSPRCPALKRAEGAAEIIQAVQIGHGLPGVLVALAVR
jgi:hypothetical protein